MRRASELRKVLRRLEQHDNPGARRLARALRARLWLTRQPRRVQQVLWPVFDAVPCLRVH